MNTISKSKMLEVRMILESAQATRASLVAKEKKLGELLPFPDNIPHVNHAIWGNESAEELLKRLHVTVKK